MRNEIGKILAKEYQTRRDRNAILTASNIDKVYILHPKLKEIDETIRNENIEKLKMILQDGVARADSAEKIKAMHDRDQYMLKNGIAPDFDSQIYSCDLCKDTGISIQDNKEKCQCYKQLLIPLLLNNSNFRNISRYKFSNFELSLFSEKEDIKKYGSSISPRKQMEGIRNAAKYFIDNFEEEKTKSLFFLGSPGTGKTFISGCIANVLLMKGKSVLYLSAPEMFDRIAEYRMLSNSYTPDPERYEVAEATYNSILDCDLLILDDLGTETVSANRQPELLNVLNKRNEADRKMIISTNLDTSELAALYDERVLSRIFGCFSVLKFYGEDLRHKIRAEKRKI